MYEQEIERVVSDLQRVVGVSLVDSWQPARDRLVLGFRDGTLLVIVPRGPHARLHSIERRPENPAKPYSFQGLCRSRLGGVTTALRKTPGEREVAFTFSGPTPSTLLLRLTGKSAGLWLMDGESVVASIDGPAPDTLPPLPATTVPRADPPRFEPRDGSWDLGARDWFSRREGRARRDELVAAATRALQHRLARDVRLLEHLGSDRRKADEAPRLRRRGELLSANLWRVRQGVATLDVEDWDTGATEVLTWSPGTPAPLAVEKWFAQARRLEASATQVEARIANLALTIEGTRLALARVTEAPDEELRRWRGERVAQKSVASLPWREWVGPNDEIVRIGRNEAGNRRLVFQQARGHHVWMHLRDQPSAHVVLPLAKGSSPSLGHLLAGAQILLERSAFEPGDAAEVQYAWVRDVRAIPGPKTAVTVSGEKVLRVVSDPAALAGWERTEL